jgi:hypothetical protein
LIDHYFMIINLKENLQGYGLSNQFEGMRCLLHDFLFGKKLVAYEDERIFEQCLFEIIGKLMSWERKLYLCVVQIHERRQSEGRRVLITLQCQKVIVGNAWKSRLKQFFIELWMYEHKAIEEASQSCKNDFIFQYKCMKN